MSQPAVAPTPTFVVYRAFGSTPNVSYYGYCTGEEPLAAFSVGAKRSEMDRGDVRLVQANGGRLDAIEVEVLDAFIDEVSAWISRNDYRSKEIDSITGPTMFPGNIAERAAKQAPGKVAAWRLHEKQRNCATARQAYNLGMWTPKDIMNLSVIHTKHNIVRDLDSMTPQEFELKYQLSLSAAACTMTVD